jgi:uncharacterized coiled-coil protein SlyX
MDMTKATAIFLVVGLVVGFVAGYGSGFTVYQPQITNLESDLSESQAEVGSLQGQLTEATTNIATLNATLADLNATLVDARNIITLLEETNRTLQQKLGSIKATTLKLEKIGVVLEMLNGEWPESYASQLVWWQDLLRASEEVDERLAPLLDTTIADWEDLVAWIDEEPTDIYTYEWVDWVLEYFRLQSLYSKSNNEFYTLFYDIAIEALNATIAESA